jgi:putative hydrolase of the HAD superfamily
VRGGREAGFRTVWVNRTGRAWPGGPRADAEIASLAELEAVLAVWELDFLPAPASLSLKLKT